MKKHLLNRCAAIVVLSLGTSAAMAAQVTLKATSAFPKQVEMTEQFLKFVNKVNSDPEIGVKIKFLGGPEVVPAQQQAQALQNGVITMSFGPANYYFSTVPEGEALVASTIDAPQARANGGMKLLNSIYKQKMNAHLLGWFGSGADFFHVYTKDKPIFAKNGKNKNNTHVRSVELYRDLLSGMGFSPVHIQVPDVYTALQRGVVGGVAWPLIGITDLGWQKYLKYRIDPGFYNNTTIVLINENEWHEMSQRQRESLQKAANQFEKESEKSFEQKAQKTRDQLAKSGMKTITLRGAALKRYKKLTRDDPWQAMERYGGSHMKELKAHFVPNSK